VRLVPVLCALLLATPLVATAQSSHHWNASNVALASGATLEVLIDWSQTRQAMRQGWAERNPILGSHPSDGKLMVYNILAIGGNLGIGAALPSRWRTVWFSTIAAVEAFTIAGNASLGLHVGF